MSLTTQPDSNDQVATTDLDLDIAALNQLNQDQRVLLDIIDDLRAIGVERYAPLPQLIVVGDQSSGKSSVLEAISGFRFPVRNSVCTRFATELVLHTAPTLEIGAKIRRDEYERVSTEMLDLNIREPFSKDDIPRIIEEAKRIMGIRKLFRRCVVRGNLRSLHPKVNPR